MVARCSFVRPIQKEVPQLMEGALQGCPKANRRVERIICVGFEGGVGSLYILHAQFQTRCKPKILLTCGH